MSDKRPLKAIRSNCMECCGNSSWSVAFCASIDCHLWNYRFGKRKSTVISNQKKSKVLFDKENFKPGGLFDPTIEVSELRKRFETI